MAIFKPQISPSPYADLPLTPYADLTPSPLVGEGAGGEGFALATHNLSVGYAPSRKMTRIVAESLNLTVSGGEFVCLLGPNGAGKSTLLRTLAGMQAPLAGRVDIDGTDLHALTANQRAKKLAVVLTERVSPGLLTGWELVALGRHPHTGWMGGVSEQDVKAVKRAVAAVGAEHLAPRTFIELSDGERQKLMIARALAQEPHVLLLDEPTAFLDAPRRAELMILLRQVARTANCAVLASTHDLQLAQRSADRLWLMDGTGGVISGTLNDSALYGGLARAFSVPGLTYDPHTGTFENR